MGYNVIDTLGTFSAILHKAGSSCDFLIAFQLTDPFWEAI